MHIGVVADAVYEALAGSPITDQRILDFIDMGEWISLWLGVTITLISLFGLVAIYAERKVSAHMQSRLGPMRVGPKGLLQTLADGLKLLEKEDLTPDAADPVLFTLAPMFVFASAMAMFVVLPFFSWEGRSEQHLFEMSPTEIVVLDGDPMSDDDDAVAAWEDAKSEALEGKSELQRRKTLNAIDNGEALRDLTNDEALGGEIEDLLNQTPFNSLEEAFNAWHQRVSVPSIGGASVEQTTVGRLVDLHATVVSDRAAKAEAANSPVPEESLFAGFSGTRPPDNSALWNYGGLADLAAQENVSVSREDYTSYLYACYQPLLAAAEGAGEAYAESGPILTLDAWVDRPWFGTPAWMNAGLLFILAISSISIIGVVLAGWGSNNKWSLYGAIREAAQMVSYEIPMGIGALCVVIANQSLNLMDIAQIQETGTVFGLAEGVHLGILSWNIIKFPILFVVFVMFYVGVLAHTKRAPFDLPEAESELIAGFLTEYSGMRWSLFFLAEYGEMYAMSALTAALFLGGMASPIPFVDGLIKEAGPLLWMIWGAGWMVIKSLFLVFLMMWLRWTLPRIRLDQVMYLCLKVLLPFSMVALLLQTLWSLNLIAGIVGVVVALIVLWFLAASKGGNQKSGPEGAAEAGAQLAAS